MRWFADATSLEFLDLCTCKFQEKSNAELISALDLCITPRRYFYLSYVHDRQALVDALMQNIPFFPGTDVDVCSNMKLIPVLTLMRQGDLKTCFFSDYTRYMMKRLSAGWEKETTLIYLKHVMMYFQCLGTSFFPTDVFFNHEPNIITFEKPAMTYNRTEKYSFMYRSMKNIGNVLIKLLRDNECADSPLITEVFHTMCLPWINEFFFKYEASRMEYIFYHIRKTNFQYFLHILNILQKDPECSVFLRSNPDHLLVFLKNGINFQYSPILRPYQFYGFYSAERPEINWGRIPTFLRRRWTNKNRREAVIVEICTNLSAWSVSQFAAYLKCLCLIWRSVPDPLLSYDEMRRFLLRHTDSKSVEAICDELQSRECDNFDLIHQPRTLSHYCRCVLRGALMGNAQLPDGIGLLPLPKRLQSYLRLDF